MAADITPYLDLITSEHADKPNFVAMVSAVVQPFADMAAVMADTPVKYDLDNAEGQQLDVIGQWVGISRKLVAPISGVYFAFDDSSLGFDQGVWLGPYDPTTGLVSLPDDFYRLLIKARILNNSWDGSKNSAYAIVDAIFSSSGFSYYIDDHADLTISVGLLGPTPPTPLLTALLNNGVFDVKGITIRISSRIAAQGPVFAFDSNSLLFKGFDQAFWT